MSSDTVPVTQADKEMASAIRGALYRACPNMPSFPVGIIEPYLAQHRATPTPSPAMPSRVEAVAVAHHVCREVAELPDRSSPEDWPEAMLVTAGELHQIVTDAILALTSVDRASGAGWMPIETAPRNSTLVELVVDYSDGEHPLNDAILACTIGFNGFDDNGEDEWKFAGWCWTHDHWVQGKGRPVAWRPSRLNAYDDGLPPLPTLSSIGSEAE